MSLSVSSDLPNYDNDDEQIDLGEFGEAGETDEIDLGVEDISENSELPSLTDVVIEDQMQVIIDQISRVEALKPEIWAVLSETERLGTLQEVENTIANVQGRPPVEIKVDPEAPEGVFGGYDPNTNSITVSGWHINSDNIQEVVDTIAHEGRHAYQYHSINHPGFHPNQAEVETWRENFNFYLDAETYGQELYQYQPVEADAWKNGSKISEILYNSKS